MPAAIQRARIMGSPKNNTAPAMMKIGPVKPMAVISAIATFGKAMNQSMRPSVCTKPRQICPRRLCGIQAIKPLRNMKGSITTSPIR